MITLIHREDMRKLDVGQHIVVGTPGRVFDMISRKVLADQCNILKFKNHDKSVCS